MRRVESESNTKTADDPGQNFPIRPILAGFGFGFEFAVNPKDFRIAEFRSVRQEDWTDRRQDTRFPINESPVAVEADYVETRKIKVLFHTRSPENKIPQDAASWGVICLEIYLLNLKGCRKVNETADSAGSTISLLPV